MISTYDKLDSLGYWFTNAPRANPENRLDKPFILRDLVTNKVVLRGFDRDDLEEKCERFMRRHTVDARLLAKRYRSAFGEGRRACVNAYVFGDGSSHDPASSA